MMLRVFILTLLISWVTCYKILIYSPTLSRSHMIQNGRVGDALARGGHNVTVLELDLAITPGSLKQVKHADLWTETFDWPDRVPGEFYISDPITFTSIDLITGLPEFLEMFGGSCLAILKSPHIMNRIRDANFDVIMFEQFDFCPFFISHLLGIKVKVWMSSCPIMEHQASLSGVPPAYSYVPVADGSTCSDKMTFPERFVNVLLAYGLENVYLRYWNAYHDRLKQEFGSRSLNGLQLTFYTVKHVSSQTCHD
uniref:glucuronosyltransferase n=1 Tax=Bursaphelenchus xylophilus TaxID=6326 RepID=A0A1I7RXT7_BURXY